MLSIIKMKPLKIFLSFLTLFLLNQSFSVSPGGRNNQGNTSNSEKQYLFPGTGFFKKIELH